MDTPKTYADLLSTLSGYGLNQCVKAINEHVAKEAESAFLTHRKWSTVNPAREYSEALETACGRFLEAFAVQWEHPGPLDPGLALTSRRSVVAWAVAQLLRRKIAEATAN